MAAETLKKMCRCDLCLVPENRNCVYISVTLRQGVGDRGERWAMPPVRRLANTRLAIAHAPRRTVQRAWGFTLWDVDDPRINKVLAGYRKVISWDPEGEAVVRVGGLLRHEVRPGLVGDNGGNRLAIVDRQGDLHGWPGRQRGSRATVRETDACASLRAAGLGSSGMRLRV